MDTRTPVASETTVAYEKGRRRPVEGKPGAVYVFADGHTELGGLGEVFPGLALTVWEFDLDTWERLKTTEFGAHPLLEDDWFRGTWYAWWELDLLHKGQSRQRIAIEPGHRLESPVLRLRGSVSFPSEGKWELKAEGVRWGYLWIDMNQDGVMDGAELCEERSDAPAEGLRLTCEGARTKQRYRLLFMFRRKLGDGDVKLVWTTPEGSEETVPDKAFSHTLN